MSVRSSSNSGPREAHTSMLGACCADGELLGSYVLSSELSAGHLTTVHRAHAAGIASPSSSLVIKRLQYGHVHDAADRELLLAAGRAGMRVRSRYLARVLAVHEDPEPFLVMEHIEGVSLSELLDETSDQEVHRYVFPILVDVLEALDTLHGLRDGSGAAAGLVHGAPSARHILVGDDGVARLIDLTHAQECAPRGATGAGFRIAARRSQRLRPAEMAPEQVLAPMHLDARCDLFIVGSVLWRALTGQPLFEHEQRDEAFQQLLCKPILAPSAAGAAVGTRFDRICLRALARTPAERFASAAEMARALKAEAERAGMYATREEIGSLVRTLAMSSLVPEAPRASSAAGDATAAERAARVPPRCEPLDVLSLHHRSSSIFGWPRVSLSDLGASAPAAAGFPRPSATTNEGHGNAPPPDAALASGTDDALESRSSWYEGLPSIFPKPHEQRTMAPFWLWGSAAAVVVMGSIMVDNPPWQHASQLRAPEAHAAPAPTTAAAELGSSGSYADFFESPRSTSRSSALRPHGPSKVGETCAPENGSDAHEVSSQAVSANAQTGVASAPQSNDPNEQSHASANTQLGASKAKLGKRTPLMPLPPNPY